MVQALKQLRSIVDISEIGNWKLQSKKFNSKKNKWIYIFLNEKLHAVLIFAK